MAKITKGMINAATSSRPVKVKVDKRANVYRYTKTGSGKAFKPFKGVGEKYNA